MQTSPPLLGYPEGSGQAWSPARLSMSPSDGGWQWEIHRPGGRGEYCSQQQSRREETRPHTSHLSLFFFWQCYLKFCNHGTETSEEILAKSVKINAAQQILLEICLACIVMEEQAKFFQDSYLKYLANHKAHYFAPLHTSVRCPAPTCQPPPCRYWVAVAGAPRALQSPPSSRLDKPHATSVVPWSLQVTNTLTAQKPGHQYSCEVHKHQVTVSFHNPLRLCSHWYNPEAIRTSGPTIHSHFSLRPAGHLPPGLFQPYSPKA